jgi:hypothetical protein
MYRSSVDVAVIVIALVDVIVDVIALALVDDHVHVHERGAPGRPAGGSR